MPDFGDEAGMSVEDTVKQLIMDKWRFGGRYSTHSSNDSEATSEQNRTERTPSKQEAPRDKYCCHTSTSPEEAKAIAACLSEKGFEAKHAEGRSEICFPKRDLKDVTTNLKEDFGDTAKAIGSGNYTVINAHGINDAYDRYLQGAAGNENEIVVGVEKSKKSRAVCRIDLNTTKEADALYMLLDKNGIEVGNSDKTILFYKDDLQKIETALFGTKLNPIEFKANDLEHAAVKAIDFDTRQTKQSDKADRSKTRPSTKKNHEDKQRQEYLDAKARLERDDVSPIGKKTEVKPKDGHNVKVPKDRVIHDREKVAKYEATHDQAGNPLPKTQTPKPKKERESSARPKMPSLDERLERAQKSAAKQGSKKQPSIDKQKLASKGTRTK